MVLWKKESKSADAPFVDLFKNCLSEKKFLEWKREIASGDWKSEYLFALKLDSGKNNRTSRAIREMGGNPAFERKSLDTAMASYNKSLCFAVPGTENVSLAYANRASCFFEMEMYDKGLADIELAKQAKYPNMEKLMAREAKFQRAKNSTKQATELQPKLSFPTNKNFPCMANVLEVNKNIEFGRHIVANADIDVGQTVLIEKAYITLGSFPDRVMCYNCMKGNENFIACPNCTDVMFCNEKCREENIIHKKFCGANFNRMPLEVRYLAESALMGILVFATADEMMNFTAETLLKRRQYIPKAANDLQSKYKLFLNLEPNKSRTVDLLLVYKVFTALMDTKMIKSMFNSVQRQRFLMHLIAEHSLIISNNGFGIPGPIGGKGYKMELVTSLFNHSCAPNIFNGLNGDSDVFITVRPIKKGDQLFMAYRSEDMTTPQRQAMLELKFNFLCKCDKCNPHCPLTARLAMVSHPDMPVLRKVQMNQQFNVPNLKEKCVNFLQMFGHLPWSEEMDVVLENYHQVLRNEYFTQNIL